MSEIISPESRAALSEPLMTDKNNPYNNWLDNQCQAIRGCYAAVLVVPQELELQTVATWPSAHIDLSSLHPLLNQAVEEQGGLIRATAGTENSNQYSVAYPIRYEQQLLAVVALSVQVSQKSQLPTIMKLLEWGASFFQAIIYQQESARSKEQQERLVSSLSLLTQVMSERHSDTSQLRLISELAHRLQCDWVALGEVREQKVTLKVFSNSSQQDHKMNRSRLIELAMEESFDQLQSLAAPNNLLADTTNLAQRTLAEDCNDKSILSVPLLHEDSASHMLTLLRPKGNPFTTDDALLVESILGLVGSYLFLQKQVQQSLLKTTGQRVAVQCQRLLGRGYLKRKLLVLLLFLLVGLTLIEGDDRISADAVLIGAKLRVIVSPLPGYIQSAQVRAGDQVKEGDSLFSLDDADLKLEKLKWQSQKAKLRGEYQAATASLDRAKMSVLKAQLDQVEAQLSLVAHQQSRSVQHAPFDALVVSGDLSQRLGAQVNQGEVLFELSPLNAYRIDLRVKQARIAAIEPGQEGLLYLSALPQHAFPFTVDRLTPVTASEDGLSYFIVEGVLSNPADALQPGMAGIGKVQVGRDRYVNLWTREWIDWVRIWYWSWWG